MGFLGIFLKFSLECFDILAWPLIALGYPLCASIQAIETDSNSDTQKLITYWVCFSLILLFEHAFLKLLLWLPFWPYIKLVIVGYLVAPEFDGSFYVYKHLVHPCLSMDRFVKLKEFFKKDELLFEVNRDAKEIGAESLKNIIASKPEFEEPKVVQKGYNAVEITEKKELASTIQPEFEEPKVVQKGYNAVEITEKKELASTIQVGQIKLALSENRTCEPMDIKEIIAAMVASRDLPAVASSNDIQKEWTCALCQVTTSCEANLISHLNGRRHEDAREKLKAKNQILKSKVSLVMSETDKSLEIKEMANTKVAVRDVSGNSYLKSTLNPWTCALCQVIATSKTDIVSHFQGKRHDLALENLENKEQMTTAVPAASVVDVQNPWTCGLCRATISTETRLILHLKGKRHREACERHKASHKYKK